VIVVHVDYDVGLMLVFLINSRIHPLIENNPTLKACQISLKKSKYPFLDHDSYLNCCEVFDSLDIDTAIDHLLRYPKDFKGQLLEEESLEVIQAVNTARTISEYDKSLIIESLGD